MEERLEEIFAAWHSFMTGVRTAGHLREPIAASRQRCLSLGLAQTAPPSFWRVSEAELMARLQANQDLLTASDPHLEWLYELLRNDMERERHVVCLVDRTGIVMRSHGMGNASLVPGTDWSETRMGTNAMGTSLVTGRPVAVLGPEHFLQAFQDCACVAAPLRRPSGELAGAIDVSAPLPVGTPDRLVLITQVAAAIEGALGTGQPPTVDETAVSIGLRENLHPVLPTLPKLEMAAAYRPHPRPGLVGGDLFDVFTVGPRRIAMVVADACGNNLHASLIAARMRYMMRVQAAANPAPDVLMAAMNRFVASFPTPLPSFMTAIYATLDLDSGQITFVNAGHPLPLVLEGSGCTRLSAPQQPALGVREDAVYRNSVYTLSRGDVLLMLTDGLLENDRNRDIDTAEKALCDWLSNRKRSSVAQLADDMLAWAANFAPLRDDVVVLGVRRT